MALTVGLTGGIGAGKSTVAAIFAELGAQLVVGDELGKRAVEESKELSEQIRARFGDAVFNGADLNRRKLGALVFTNADHVRWLTNTTFPFIHEAWQSAVNISSAKVIVFDAALIFEWGIEDEFDKVVVVTAANERIIERADSGKLSAEDLIQRQAMQLPIARKTAGADYVIENNRDLNSLRESVKSIWLELISIYK